MSSCKEKDILEICQSVPVIPVLTVADETHSEPIAEALVSGGLHVIEVTLRTECALSVIRRMSSVSGCIVGAGTLVDPSNVEDARQAGAMFGVSPAAPYGLAEACAQARLPLLPGAATPTEIIRLLKSGHEFQKFFPAEPAGGVAALKAIAGPIPEVRFCPTGGITSASAPTYLNLDNVVCVGGSWVVSQSAVASGNWAEIESNARFAASLGSTRNSEVKQ